MTTDSSASLGTRYQVVGEVKTGVRRVPVSSYSKEGCTFHLSKPSRSLWRCRLPLGSGTDPQSFPSPFGVFGPRVGAGDAVFGNTTDACDDTDSRRVGSIMN